MSCTLLYFCGKFVRQFFHRQAGDEEDVRFGFRGVRPDNSVP